MEVIDDCATRYRERGYVVIRELFPRHMLETYREFLERALVEDVAPIFARCGLDLDQTEVGNQALRRIESDRQLTPPENQVLRGQFPLQIRLSEKILPIAHFLGQSTLLQMIMQSEDLFMHMPPMSRFVLPHYTPAGVPAHQDRSYNSHMSEFVTVWTPLVPIDAACGGLALYEDSQNVVHAGQESTNGWLAPIAVQGMKRSQPVGLNVGDVILLSPEIVHASVPNTSNRTRFSMDLRVFGSTTRSRKHHMNLKTLEILSNL